MSAFLAVWIPAPEARSRAAAAAFADKILNELEHFSDRCQALPPDRWLLNLEGMEVVLGPPATIGMKLGTRLQTAGVEAWIGVARTRTAALLAASQRRRWAIEADDPAPALAPLPITALRALIGFEGPRGGPAAAECLELFERWGLKTLGEVAALPRRALAERLGRTGVDCQRWAQGGDQGLMLPTPRPAPQREIEARFEPALEGYLPVLAWLEPRIQEVCTELERRDRALTAAALKLELDGRSTWEWGQRFPLPHRDGKRLRRQMETALAMRPPLAPVTAIALQLNESKPRRTQTGLFGEAVAESQPLERLLSRLRELLDDPEGQRCGSPRRRDLHRSDAFVMTPFSPEALERSRPPQASVAGPAPGVERLCLKRLRPPPPIRMTLPGLPAADGLIHPAGALCQLPRGPRQRVVRASGPWRNSGEWWTDGAWSRDEWDVELSGQRQYRLLYDRRERRWYLLGEYD